SYKRVMATEVSRSAARWAEQNIRINRLNNVEFSHLSAERWLSRHLTKIDPVDLVVLDPPRAGATRKVLSSLCQLKAAEIVYVSCDPSTLARDLHLLTNEGYNLQAITGVDLFPQSYHVETVATLKC